MTEFSGPIRLRMGDPCLIIRHPDGPWTTHPYTDPADLVNMRNADVHEVGGIKISTGETTVKGSTVLPDGTVKTWERPALAYASHDEFDSFGDGDGTGDTNTDATYLFPKHRS